METGMSESTLSLGECARRIGVSKGTISKAIASGKLSATRREDGSWAIDGAELSRYVEVNGHRFRSATGATIVPGEQTETPDATVVELAELKARAELAEARLSDLRELCASFASSVTSGKRSQAGCR